MEKPAWNHIDDIPATIMNQAQYVESCGNHDLYALKEPEQDLWLCQCCGSVLQDDQECNCDELLVNKMDINSNAEYSPHCLNCDKPLEPGRLKFCSNQCQSKVSQKHRDAKKYNITVGQIKVVARLDGNNEPEWMLPGCSVTHSKEQAEQIARQLNGYIGN